MVYLQNLRWELKCSFYSEFLKGLTKLPNFEQGGGIERITSYAIFFSDFN